MADEVLARAIVEIGVQGIADAKGQIATLEGSLKALEAGYRAGTISLTDYLQGSTQLQGQIAQLTGAVTVAQAAVTKYGSAQAASAAMAKQAAAQMQQAGSQGAMGLLVLSQAVDDVQYGFKAIVNNIPQMGMAIGSTLGMSSQSAMKLGGIMGILAVAINVVINHWDQLFQRFGYGTQTMSLAWRILFGETKDVADDAIKAIEARIKELEAKPLKLSVEMTELDAAKVKYEELKTARAAWEQLGKGRGAFEAASGAAVTGVLSGLDRGEAERVQKDMMKARAKRMEATSPAILRENLTDAEKEEIRGATGVPIGGGAGGKAAAEQRAIDDEQAKRREAANKARVANEKKAAEEIGGIYARAASGTDVDAQKKLAAALRDAKREDLAGRVEEAAPAKLKPGFATAKEQQEQEATDAEGRKRARDLAERQKARAKATAGALDEGAVARDILKGRRMSDAELERNVKKEMDEAGLDEQKHGAAAEVARQLQDQLKEKIAARAGREGVSGDTARADLLREATAARRFGVDSTQGREVERITGAMEHGAVGRSLLKTAAIDEENLRAQIAESLKKAGMGAEEIGELTPEIARKLREKIDKDVAQRALDRGITAEAARAELSKEEERNFRARELKSAGKSEVISTETYMNKLLTAGLGKTDAALAMDTLTEARSSGRTLREIHRALLRARARGGPPVFGPGRTP